MTQVITFNLGAVAKSTTAPELPPALDQSVFHTRQEIRDHQDAQRRYYDYQRQVANKARIDADNARARDLANAQREQTDDEYDALKRKQWVSIPDQRDR